MSLNDPQEESFTLRLILLCVLAAVVAWFLHRPAP